MTIKLRTLGVNATELDIRGHKYLFSYDTLVACTPTPSVWFKTNVKHSKTTTKHINQWLHDNGVSVVTEVEPSVLESVLAAGYE